MRLFLALEVPAEVREAIWRNVEKVPGAFGGARWVRPEGLHLTLLFLGEVADAAVPKLIAACAAAAAGCPGFEARLEAGGWFPPRGPARALWVGLQQGGALAALQARLTEAAGPVEGEAGPARPFHAHLTLARCEPPWPRARAAEFVAKLGSLADLRYPVSEAVLMRSHLGRGGSRYEAVARFALALPAAASAAT